MKLLIFTLTILLTINMPAQAKKSDDCGHIRAIGIEIDLNGEWVTDASIKAKTWIRITEDNSPELAEALSLSLASDTDGEDKTKGYFVCLDEYDTYYDYRQKYANVTKYRLWKDGELISQVD